MKSEKAGSMSSYSVGATKWPVLTLSRAIAPINTQFRPTLLLGITTHFVSYTLHILTIYKHLVMQCNYIMQLI